MANGKVLNMENLISFAKLIVGVVAAVVTVLVFYFTMEAKQSEKITQTATTLTEHLKDSKATFDKLARTLMEQRQINQSTNNTLVWVSTLQQTLKEENDRLARSVEKLADEVRKRNGHTPQ